MWLPLSRQPAMPNGRRLLDSFSPVPTADEIQALRTKYPSLHFETVRIDRFGMVVTAWFSSNTRNLANQQAAAHFTLEVFAPCDPLLQKIDLLLTRPDSRMLPSYSDAALAKDVWHPFILGKTAEVLSLEAKANLVLGNHDAALEKVLSLARLARVGNREPLLMPFSVRESAASLCVARIHQGLTSHVWSDSDLQVFEASLAPIDLLRQFPEVLRGERAIFNELVRNSKYQISTYDPDANAWDKFSVKAADTGWTLVFVPADQACYNRIMESWIDDANRAIEHGLGEGKITDPTPYIYNRRFGRFRYTLSDAFLPDISYLASRVAQVQDLMVQARIACALERCRLKNGSYPSELSALVPAFLPSIPPDVVTRNPMYYQQTSDGFRLWSVGWTGINEGGLESENNDRKRGNWLWSEPPQKDAFRRAFL